MRTEERDRHVCSLNALSEGVLTAASDELRETLRDERRQAQVDARAAAMENEHLAQGAAKLAEEASKRVHQRKEASLHALEAIRLIGESQSNLPKMILHMNTKTETVKREAAKVLCSDKSLATE